MTVELFNQRNSNGPVNPVEFYQQDSTGTISANFDVFSFTNLSRLFINKIKIIEFLIVER